MMVNIAIIADNASTSTNTAECLCAHSHVNKCSTFHLPQHAGILKRGYINIILVIEIILVLVVIIF